jgi:hypothetical protein
MQRNHEINFFFFIFKKKGKKESFLPTGWVPLLFGPVAWFYSIYIDLFSTARRYQIWILHAVLHQPSSPPGQAIGHG